MQQTPPGPIRRLWDRFGHLVHELGKFGVVGGTAFAVDTLIFGALLRTGMDRLLAKTIATVIAATLAFLGNRFWTWRHRGRSGLAREYGLYFFYNAVGLAITLVVLFLSGTVLGAVWPGVFHTFLADLIAGSIVGNAAATAFRFWAYRRFVFLAGAPGHPSDNTPVPGVPAPATDCS
ncbi:GtrA family protein [Rhizomonospora bruguierae]|uniref:GtrA family protein n=1 Tax=Rhizomonospora bruguierae TaxID=1581705 RepID=UPI0020BE5FD1|nr:GtrA family protein [Micromonospora sp. NBRC 107566]